MLPAALHVNPASLWRRGFLLLVFTLATVAMLVCIATHALWAMIFGLILLVFLWIYWRQREPISALIAQAGGEVEALGRTGSVELMRVLPSSVVTPALLVLHLQSASRRRVLVLWPDSAPVETLRQWRVWLRWIWPTQQVKSD